MGFNNFYNTDKKEFKHEHISPNPLIRRGEKDIKWFKLDMMFPAYDKYKNKCCLGPVRGVWGKLFKRSIIEQNKIRFDESIAIAEDAMFCFDYLKCSRSVALFDEYLIHYKLHELSVMKKYQANISLINERSLIGFLNY